MWGIPQEIPDKSKKCVEIFLEKRIEELDEEYLKWRLN